MKLKYCKHCKTKFEPQRPLQYLCSVECSYKYAKILSEKKARKEHIEQKKMMLTHKDYLKMLQTVFNTYIRKRDEQRGCITCGTSLKNRKFDAGHFYSVGGYPNVRFDEDNVHGQCVHCNQHNHGNLHKYREKMPFILGWERFFELEKKAKQTSGKLTIEEIKEKIKEYKLKIKQLKNN